MSFDKNSTDVAWHRRLGRRLFAGQVGESRTRGAYINGRIAIVLAVSIVGAIVALGVVFFAIHGIG